MGWQKFLATDYFLILISAWLALLSFYLLKTIGHYRRITKGAQGRNIEQILERLLVLQNSDSKKVVQIAQEIKKLEEVQKANFQKYALVRFNPFEDTGGDQSFVVALLDGANNGFIISSLHSREGTRVYAKPVKSGKPTMYQFSKEEKEVVEKACQPVRQAGLPTGKTARQV
ncbi:DUF4446 family protein [Candidatus Curtissbacteria bacterium]|nr:DUF4446 family protein [Candidatus Curtissbacteria bacterium]